MSEESGKPEQSKEEQKKPDPVKFDFTKKEGVLKAYEVSADAAVNQSMPMSNVLGVQRAAGGAVRLAELELKYQIFKQKVNGGGDSVAPTIKMLEENADTGVQNPETASA